MDSILAMYTYEEFYVGKSILKTVLHFSFNIVVLYENSYAKQKHRGVKSAGPIRSNIANRQARPKGLISVEAKKLL